MNQHTQTPLFKFSALGTTLLMMGVAHANQEAWTVDAGTTRNETILITSEVSGAQGIVVNGTLTPASGYGIVVSGANARLTPTMGYGIHIGSSGVVHQSVDVKGGSTVSGAQGGIFNEGTITATSGAHGISVANGSKVSTIVNAGTIEGNRIGINVQNTSKVDAIRLLAGSVTTAQTASGIQIGTPSAVGLIEVAGTLHGQRYGILNEGTLGERDAQEPSLVVHSGANIAGETAGIGNSGTIHGGIEIEKGATVSSIQNFGAGAITASPSGVTVRNAGTITSGIDFGTNSGQDVHFENAGTLGSDGISYTGSGSLIVTNVGKVTGAITAPSASSITIKDWYLHGDAGSLTILTTGADSTESTHGQDHVKVQKVTVADADAAAHAVAQASKIDLGEKVLVNGVATQVESAGLSADLQKMGFQSAYESDANKLNVFYLADKTAGALLAKSVVSASVRRDYFVNTMMDEEVRVAQSHFDRQQAQSSVFVKPYGARTTLQTEATHLTGSTVGVLLGGNYVSADGGVTAYAGYEESRLDADAKQFALDSDTLYAGAAAYANWAHVAGLDVWSKLGASIAYSQNDLTRALEATQSTSATDALSVNAALTLGVNWQPVASTLVTPSVSLGYGSIQVDSFTLSNELSTDRYQLETVTMPYADVNVHWQQRWNDAVRTHVGAGVRVLLDNEQALTSTFGTTTLTSDYRLSSSYEYVSAGMTVALHPKNEVSVGYTGIFEGKGQSHNIVAKYEYLF